jgi:hypothetical protein
MVIILYYMVKVICGCNYMGYIYIYELYMVIWYMGFIWDIEPFLPFTLVTSLNSGHGCSSMDDPAGGFNQPSGVETWPAHRWFPYSKKEM